MNDAMIGLIGAIIGSSLTIYFQLRSGKAQMLEIWMERIRDTVSNTMAASETLRLINEHVVKNDEFPKVVSELTKGLNKLDLLVKKENPKELALLRAIEDLVAKANIASIDSSGLLIGVNFSEYQKSETAVKDCASILMYDTWTRVKSGYRTRWIPIISIPVVLLLYAISASQGSNASIKQPNFSEVPLSCVNQTVSISQGKTDSVIQEQTATRSKKDVCTCKTIDSIIIHKLSIQPESK